MNQHKSRTHCDKRKSEVPITHRPTEEATAWAALVFHHAGPMVLTQNQQLDRVGRPHHLMFQDSVLTPGQLKRTVGEEGQLGEEMVSVSQLAVSCTTTRLKTNQRSVKNHHSRKCHSRFLCRDSYLSVYTLRGHAFPISKSEDLAALRGLHAAATKRKFLYHIGLHLLSTTGHTYKNTCPNLSVVFKNAAVLIPKSQLWFLENHQKSEDEKMKTKVIVCS